MGVTVTSTALTVVADANRLRGSRPRADPDDARTPATDAVVGVGRDENKRRTTWLRTHRRGLIPCVAWAWTRPRRPRTSSTTAPRTTSAPRAAPRCSKRTRTSTTAPRRPDRRPGRGGTFTPRRAAWTRMEMRRDAHGFVRRPDDPDWG